MNHTSPIPTLHHSSPSPPIEIPYCEDITSPGYYYLTNDIYGYQDGKYYCIGIFSSNVVLDGKNWTITGDGNGAGISVIGINNATITRVNIRRHQTGIDIRSSSSIIVEYVTLEDETWFGIYIDHSSSNMIKNSLISNAIDGDGVYLFESTGNKLDSVIVKTITMVCI